MSNTTAPSTADLPATIRALCPSAHADLADRLFEELACYRDQPVKATGVETLRRELAAVRAELARYKAIDAKKAANMRAARTARIEAQVIDAIQAKKSRLEREPRHNWTSILQEHYFDKRKIKAPDEEVIRRVVKAFPGF